ncbi:hypothetical protein ANN_04368 [Periplaneta americana]|uniref:Uncharacterized protein n=1 Tax=Periplaneta americana TaxID=6978 RepID=A0ABQ8T9J9_PERAM|nr:hypothetical protein ANN_04368 [Periplaneta americana]
MTIRESKEAVLKIEEVSYELIRRDGALLEDILFIDSNFKIVSKSIILLESSKLQLSEALNIVDKVSQTVIQNNNSLISEKVKCHDKTSEVGVLKSSNFPFFKYGVLKYLSNSQASVLGTETHEVQNARKIVPRWSNGVGDGECRYFVSQHVNSPSQCSYAEVCYTYRSQAGIGLHTTVMHITDPPVLLQSGDCTRVMTSFILGVL